MFVARRVISVRYMANTWTYALLGLMDVIEVGPLYQTLPPYILEWRATNNPGPYAVLGLMDVLELGPLLYNPESH